MKLLRALAAALVAGLAACTPITLVQPQRQVIAGNYSVAPSVPWNKVSAVGLAPSGLQGWTRDGLALQELIFIAAADGERLLHGPNSAQTAKMPVFRSFMTPLDVKDLVESTLAHREFQNIVTTNLRPAKFGAADGFQFDLDFSGKSGLKKKGIAAGAMVEGKLLFILYLAAERYYFQRDRAEAVRIIHSVELVNHPVARTETVPTQKQAATQPSSRSSVPQPRQPIDPAKEAECNEAANSKTLAWMNPACRHRFERETQSSRPTIKQRVDPAKEAECLEVADSKTRAWMNPACRHRFE